MKLVSAFLLAFLLAAGSLAQIKKPEPVAVKAPFTKSLQIVVVTTKDWNATSGTARLFERKNEKADWKQVGDSFPVMTGRSGLALDQSTLLEVNPPKIKQEGDGNAPAGLFPLTASFGTSEKPNAVQLPYTRLDQYTECVDDVKSSFYNQIVNRMQVGNFDWKSSEKMLAIGHEYDLGVFVGYNSYPVRKGEGSCIFLHIWHDPTTATDGCTAMDRHNLERIVPWISPSKNPYLVQMPESLYNDSRKAWKLPKIK